MYTNKQFSRRDKLFLIWLTLAVIALSACSLINRGPTLGSDVELPLQTQAIMSCNETCSGYGQCGADAAGNQYVLGGQASPLVENHDRLFPAGTAVTILSSNLQTVQLVSNNSQFQLRFYYVQLPDGRPDGWVAGWCLAVQ